MDKTLKLLDETAEHCDFVTTCHYVQAEGDKKRRIRCGLPAALINVIVGSVLVADLGKAVPDTMKWITALLALVSTFLIGVQTFFNFSDREKGHRELGNKFNRMARLLARARAAWLDKNISDADFAKRFEAVMDEYEEVCRANEAMPPSREVAEKLKRQLEAKSKRQTGRA